MQENIKTGWERENRIIFDDIVVKYDEVRWDYPAELFSDVIKYATPEKGGKAIEIGAGTGKATKPFLDAGYDVTAVELGENMTEFLLDKYKGYPNFHVITSSFEDVTLEDNSYDLVYAASAFHWVDAAVGCPKVFDLLKSGGAFVLIRSNWLPPDDDKIDNDIQKVYEEHYYSHYDIKKRPLKSKETSTERFRKPSEIFKGFRFNGMEEYGFVDVTMMFYNSEKTYSTDNYLALLDTFSDHRALPDENKKALYAGVKEVLKKHNNQIKVKNVYQLYMGRKPQG